jgi:hypothetical protein
MPTARASIVSNFQQTIVRLIQEVTRRTTEPMVRRLSSTAVPKDISRLTDVLFQFNGVPWK